MDSATSSCGPAGNEPAPFPDSPVIQKPLAVWLLGACLCAPLAAWGDVGHRLVVAQAVKRLPTGPAAWLRTQAALMAEHASDPDAWKRHDRKEGARHFLNADRYGGPKAVPRDIEQAMRQLGDRSFARAGQAPWVVQDRFRDLVRAFTSGDPQEIALRSAILSHYIADLQVPLHTTSAFDGEDPSQRGIHHRWETGLMERYLDPSSLSAEPIRMEPDPLGAPWRWMQESHGLVTGLLADDREASAFNQKGTRGRRRSGAYWPIFRERQSKLVKRQLDLAAERTAQMITAAWKAARSPKPNP